MLNNQEIKNNFKPNTILYYSVKENRQVELLKYINKYKTLDYMFNNKDGKYLLSMFSKNKVRVYEVAEELGYDIRELYSITPKGYYNDFSKIKIKVNLFIKEYNRFPSQKDFMKVLGIDARYITKFGGINNIKKMMNYNDKEDLIDLRGDFNRSQIELIVANYLCSQGLKDKYLREQNPFPKEEGFYRSDFMLKDEKNRKDIHIEVWGYNEDKSSKMCSEYNKIKKNKLKLYKKYEHDIILISIEYSIFTKKYADIEKSLYNILNPYLKLKYKSVDYKLLISPSKLTDEELLQEILNYNTDKEVLPFTKDISGTLYLEILKRYGSYKNFAEKFNKKLTVDKNEWTEELVFNYFENIISDGFKITKETMFNEYSNLYEGSQKFGYLVDMKLKFFKTYSNQLPKDEIKWLIDIANGNTKSTAILTNENIKQAKNILDLIYPNYHKHKSCIYCGRSFNAFHVYNILCKNCIESTKNNQSNGKRYKSVVYTEKEYDDNFYSVADQDFKLCQNAFNKISKINSRTYVNYFKMKWTDILKRYNKYEDLYNFVLNEFKKYISNTASQDLHEFSRQHKDITYDLLREIGTDKIMKSCGLIKLKYTDQQYKNNFEGIKIELDRCPLYHEFSSKTNITIEAYANKFKLKGKVYDEIVKIYSTKEEYNEYLVLKKQHKSNVGKQTGKLSAKYSEADLKENFIKVFENYFKDYDKYPSRRDFDKISRPDSSSYRRRLGMAWQEVKLMYGYQ